MGLRLVLPIAVALVVVSGTAHAHPGHPVAPPVGTPTPTTPTYADGWRELAPIGTGPRQEHSVTAVNGKVYVIGGIVPDGAGGVTTTNRVEVYDTRRGTWAEAAPLPIVMNHPNVATIRGRIHVLGGLGGGASWQAARDSYVYSPMTNTWTALPPMPAGTERGSAAMGTRGTKIYLAGGMRTLTPGPGGLQDTVDTVSSYDVLTRRWEALPRLPEARDHVGGAVVNGVLYVVGGRDRGQVNVRNTVYALDLETRRWTERAPMPTARGGIATAVVGTTIYALGGEGNPEPGSNSVFAENEAYDTAHDRWRRLAPMPVPRHGTAAVAVGGTIHIPGGGTVAGGGALVAVNDSYRPRGHG